jgi:branched-chain amino acid transport system permease protein
MTISRETAINVTLALILLAMPFLALQLGKPFYVTLATRMAILGLAAVGLNLALGLGGLVSFGHAAFFGVGGYAAGILASHAFAGQPLNFGLFTLPGTNQMLVVWLVAVLAGGLLAAAIGVISLRTSGVYFIMITLAFAQMTYYFAISWPAYGGEDGLSITIRNVVPGINTLIPINYFLVCYALLLTALLIFALIRGSRFGAALQASRQNELRVASIGIAPFRVRLVTFIIIVVLGGVGRLWGPVAGAMLFVVFEFVLGGLTERWQFFLGLALLAVVLFVRGGLIGFLAGRMRHG